MAMLMAMGRGLRSLLSKELITPNKFELTGRQIYDYLKNISVRRTTTIVTGGQWRETSRGKHMGVRTCERGTDLLPTRGTRILRFWRGRSAHITYTWSLRLNRQKKLIPRARRSGGER